jgi:hypothetical protein
MRCVKETSNPETKPSRQNRILAKGRTHFILWRGVIGWGITTALGFSLIMGWGQPLESALPILLISLVIFPIVGFFWGSLMWRWIEKRGKQ